MQTLNWGATGGDGLRVTGALAASLPLTHSLARSLSLAALCPSGAATDREAAGSTHTTTLYYKKMGTVKYRGVFVLPGFFLHP